MKPWIGVDLDGTLAVFHGWQGPEHIGEPIPAMVDRVKKWLADGQTVKIFTARCTIPEQIPPVREWAKKMFGVDLEVTNVKDFGMTVLWDDRCVRVEPNTGRVI